MTTDQWDLGWVLIYYLVCYSKSKTQIKKKKKQNLQKEHIKEKIFKPTNNSVNSGVYHMIKIACMLLIALVDI